MKRNVDEISVFNALEGFETPDLPPDEEFTRLFVNSGAVIPDLFFKHYKVKTIINNCPRYMSQEWKRNNNIVLKEKDLRLFADGTMRVAADHAHGGPPLLAAPLLERRAAGKQAVAPRAAARGAHAALDGLRLRALGLHAQLAHLGRHEVVLLRVHRLVAAEAAPPGQRRGAVAVRAALVQLRGGRVPLRAAVRARVLARVREKRQQEDHFSSRAV